MPIAQQYKCKCPKCKYEKITSQSDCLPNICLEICPKCGTNMEIIEKVENYNLNAIKGVFDIVKNHI